MEFYLFLYVQEFRRNEFQFPTGWNSTPRKQSKQQQRHRFNSQRDGILHLPNTREVGAKTRFNSQRDGILQ